MKCLLFEHNILSHLRVTSKNTSVAFLLPLCVRIIGNQSSFGPRHAKMCLMPYANNKGADQPADAVRYLGYTMLIEPRHEKTCLRGLRPGKTQTSLRSHTSKVEA